MWEGREDREERRKCVIAKTSVFSLLVKPKAAYLAYMPKVTRTIKMF